MPIPLRCEDLLPFFDVVGNCEVEESPVALQPPSPPVPPIEWQPTKNIQTTQHWRVRFNWQTSGILNYVMAGTWKLKIYLEAYGESEFGFTGTDGERDVTFVAAPHSYQSQDIVIEPNTVPPGVYKLVASMRMLGNSGVPGPIAAFAEGPILHFYKVGP